MLERRQYFVTRFGLLGWIFLIMIRVLMDSAMSNVANCSVPLARLFAK